MAKAADLNPKFYQELIDRVKNGQPYEDMLSNYSPEATRDILEEASAQYTKGKHPFDLFEKPELFKGVEVKEYPNLKEHGFAEYYTDPVTGHTSEKMPMKIGIRSKADTGTLLHEAQHIYDQKAQPLVKNIEPLPERNLLSKIKEELNLGKNIKSASDLKGLEQATEYYAGHFKPDTETKFEKLKQALNLERIVKGSPLKAIAPVLKVASVGALGLAAAGIGNKAYAGDYGEAAVDTADLATDFVPGIREAKMVARPTEMGNSDLPPEEMQKRKEFNEQAKKRFLQLNDKLKR